MQQQAQTHNTTDALALLRASLKSQYHAALAMLRQAVVRVPDELWSGGNFVNPAWRIAYHTLYYTHLYLQPRAEDFTPWAHHQTGIHDLDDIPAPPEIQALTEHPHRPPQTGEPYSRERILAYWTLCDGMVDAAVDALDLLAPTCGFSWYQISKLEHQLVNLRHIQHHTAQLGSRIREASAGRHGINWVGAGRTPRRSEFPGG